MPLLHRLVHWRVSVSLRCSGIVLNGGTKVPQANLTHLVVVGYGRFTQLAFEIQLKGEIQVALQVKREGEKERVLSDFPIPPKQQSMVFNKHRQFVLDNRRKRAPARPSQRGRRAH